MQVLTGFHNQLTSKWNDMIINLSRSAIRFGHQTIFGGLGSGFDSLTHYPSLYHNFCWKYKMHFILESLANNPEQDMVWIDADCLVMRPLDIEAALDGCDVALTLRDIADRNATTRPFMDGFINTGVMYFKNGLGAKLFLQQVIPEMFLSIFDQDAVNNVLLGEGSKLNKHGEIIKFNNGAKVKILNCREHNNFYFDTTSNDARILHFKGDMMEKYPAYVSKIRGEVNV